MNEKPKTVLERLRAAHRCTWVDQDGAYCGRPRPCPVHLFILDERTGVLHAPAGASQEVIDRVATVGKAVRDGLRDKRDP